MLAFKVSDELEHAYAHAHMVQAAAEKSEGIWSSLFVVGKKKNSPPSAPPKKRLSIASLLVIAISH